MKSIGFKNFRRFKNFPEINLGDITILVGANNSGKSTLIKAILLCENNIRQEITHNALFDDSTLDFTCINPKFRFDASIWNDVKIKTFQRAFNNTRQSNLKEKNTRKSLIDNHEIQFCFSINKYFKFDIKLEEKEQNKDEIECDIKFISIEVGNQFRFEESFPSRERKYIVLSENDKEENSVNCKIKDEYVIDYEEYLTETPLLFVHILSNLLNFAKNKGGHLLEYFTYIDENGHPFRKLKQFVSNDENEKARHFLSTQIKVIEDAISSLSMILHQMRTEYCHIHIVEQNYFFNASNKNDYVAQSINDYYRSGILKKDNEYKFVKKWLKKFEICNSFQIKSIGGESYTVEIIQNKSHIVNLADMGIGSIQVFTLLIRIAYFIRKYYLWILADGAIPLNERSLRKKKDKMLDMFPTIIIEEPEQNLHPKIQSLLADLFFEVNQKYGCRFIVETHSEYIIRKSQVLVKKFAKKNDIISKEDLEKRNPFKVYYFDYKNEETPYYEMRYRTNGVFSNQFGPGFLDMSRKLLGEIL